MPGKENNAIFDLACLDTAALCEQGAELELTHPATGEPLGVYLTLAGVDSKAWRKATAALAEKRLGRRGKVSAEEMQAAGLEILARCTLAWRSGINSIVRIDGEEMPCTPENARELYERFPWIFEQADRFASDRGSYLRD